MRDCVLSVMRQKYVAEDLFSLHTKGFRGEALASIAAIAHVEMKTKQDQEELGTQIIVEGSKFVSQDMAVLPKGTSFAVKNLFSIFQHVVIFKVGYGGVPSYYR
jgi:DNA mismatch repair ATPase MutL